MATYYVDDGGNNSTGADWATAYTSINSLDAAVALASGDIVNFGHDHNCQAVNAASLTIVGPAAGLPVIFRSVTQGSDPVTYQKGTGTQIDTSEAATFDLVFDGSFSLHGIHAKSGQSIATASDSNESFYTKDCTYALGPTGLLSLGSTTGMIGVHKILTVDLTQDGSTPRSTNVIVSSAGAVWSFQGLSFVNSGFRTGVVFQNSSGTITVTGADFSGFTNASLELLNGSAINMTLGNCKTPETFTFLDANALAPGTILMATNVGALDNPAGLRYVTYFGTVVSSISIYRSGGATREGIANAWLVTTTANCNEYAPFHSPWIYGLVSSTGSKTFDTFITNDTADFTNAQVWLEVEYLATSDSPLWTLASDQRATITTTAADQDDDTTSAWVGAGPVYTYKQRLRVTATVGETGQFRARVVTGVASIASTRFFHIDPLVTVT